MIWFTSDWHLFHDNIIESCARPFKNVNAMNEVLLQKYNEVVRDEDTVYFLGDLTMRGPKQMEPVRRIVLQMKGKKHYIMGNHDRFKVWSYLKMGFVSVHTALPLWDACLVHDPADALPFDTKYVFCGHVHNLWEVRAPNIVNVGVDVWDFYPVNVAALLARLVAEVPK